MSCISNEASEWLCIHPSRKSLWTSTHTKGCMEVLSSRRLGEVMSKERSWAGEDDCVVCENKRMEQGTWCCVLLEDASYLPVVGLKQCYWLSGLTAIMMRGVFFDCPALRVPCVALRCVVLCCAVWWCLSCCREKGLSPPSLLAHHHSSTKPYSQPVTWMLRGSRAGEQLTKYKQHSPT